MLLLNIVRDLRSNPSITYFPFPIKEELNDFGSMVDYDSKLGLNSTDRESDVYVSANISEDFVMISQLGQYEVYKIRNRGHDRSDWDLVQKLSGIEMLRLNGSVHIEGRYFEGGDARYFQFRGRPYIAFTLLQGLSDGINNYNNLFFMYYAELKYNYEENAVYMDLPVKRISIDAEIGPRHEKNWSPFEHIDENGVPRLLFIQNTFPHRIVHANETDARFEGKVLKGHIVCSTQFVNQYWPYGEPRGGTPAVLVNTKYGKKYLTFFHSSGNIVMKWLHSYFFGAYLFDPDPPFAISHITPHPIMPLEWYDQGVSGWSFKAIDYIIFPMGYIIRNGTIFLTSGRNDDQGWILKMDFDLLIDYLIPVEHDEHSILLNKYKEHMAHFEEEYQLSHRYKNTTSKKL